MVMEMLATLERDEVQHTKCDWLERGTGQV